MDCQTLCFLCQSKGPPSHKLAIQIMLEIKSIRSTVVKLANFTVDSIRSFSFTLLSTYHNIIVWPVRETTNQTGMASIA